jgi:hypothetical protein
MRGSTLPAPSLAEIEHAVAATGFDRMQAIRTLQRRALEREAPRRIASGKLNMEKP